jgi:hypothetical protein
MPNRTAKFASVFAGFLAATSLTVSDRAAAAASDSAAGAESDDAAGVASDSAAVAASDSAADDCLSSPKDQTPQGSHWYYRIDRATKRQCWYLRAEGEKLSKVSPPNSSVSASSSASERPAAPKSEPAVQRKMADARAELPPQRTAIEQPNRESRPYQAKPAGAAVSEINRDPKPPVAQMQPSVVASRWVGQVDANSSTNPTPPAGPAPNKAHAATNVSPASPPQLLSPAVAGQFAAADVPPVTPTHSVQMLLAAIMGALVLAAVMGRLIFKIVGMRRRARRRMRARRGAIWKSAPTTGRKRPLAYPATGTLPRRPDFPRDLDQIGDPDDGIVELLRDLSRRRRKGPNKGQFGGSFL